MLLLSHNSLRNQIFCTANSYTPKYWNYGLSTERHFQTVSTSTSILLKLSTSFVIITFINRINNRNEMYNKLHQLNVYILSYVMVI